MRVFRGSMAFERTDRPCVMTIGNFDGLHLGHRALLDTVIGQGRALGALVILYTFDPHPVQILHPERSQPRLMSWEQLRSGLENAGVDVMIREPFTREFAALSADYFFDDIICRRIGPIEVFVGRDFRFGKDRAGSGEMLKKLGPTRGIQVEIISQVRAGGRDVSSTRIRRALVHGDVEDASLCLGRPYTIRGTVVRGDLRGRTLGFPTANLDPENEFSPAAGVYATSVRIFDGDVLGQELYPSVTNIGTRPTFSRDEVVTETHLLDYSGDLYGERLELAFHARIRPEQRFSGPEELSEQIAKDVAQAAQLLKSVPG